MVISTNELRLLTLRSIVIHELPRRDPARKVKPTLSNAPSPLANDIRVFFEDKIRTSVSTGFQVCVAPKTPSPAPAQLLQLTGKKTDPVPASRKLATHLFESQTSVMSGGLLVVAQATSGNTGAVAVLKLEKEEGVQLQRTGAKGNVSFDLAKVKNLMLTSATKVFKTGLFLKRGASSDQLDGIVTDSQRITSATVATFFLETFLGCQLSATPEVSTNAFLLGVQRFINTAGLEPTERAALLHASIVELESKSTFVDPKRFARKYVETPMRKAFIDTLAAEGTPTTRFPKDLNLVSSQIKKFRITFKNGVRIIVPFSELASSVEIEDEQNGEASVLVTGELDRMK